MVKIYKLKEKLAIYLPFDVVKALRLGENDEVDFFRVNGSSFIFAKKADITSLLLYGQGRPQIPADAHEVAQAKGEESPLLSEAEIAVLKKLDTLRYESRDVESVGRMLLQAEKNTLGGLLSRKVVGLFRKGKDGKELYSISKQAYDRYLMRKKPNAPGQQQRYMQQKREVQAAAEKHFFVRTKPGIPENENVKKLEAQGFVVVQTEGEASALSMALEDSIRRGLVLGTRAFNKKFYVLLRQFFDRYSSQIIKELREGGEAKAGTIAISVGVDEDGARSILYLLSENGDVSEKRRDLFTIA